MTGFRHVPGSKLDPISASRKYFLRYRWKTSEQIIDYLKVVHQETQRKMIVIMDRWNGHHKAGRLLSEEGED